MSRYSRQEQRKQQRIARWFTGAVSVCAVALIVLCCAGCAFTAITTPHGKYVSFKDSAVEHLEITKTDPQTGVITNVVIDGAQGLASQVDQTQADALKSAIDRIPVAP